LTNNNTEHAELAEMYIRLAKKAGNPSRFSKIMKSLFVKLNIDSKQKISKSNYKQLLGAFFDLLIEQIGKDLAIYVHDAIDIFFDVPDKNGKSQKKIESTPTKQITE